MNQLYRIGAEGFLTGTLSWTNDTIKAVLVDISYTFSEAHSYLSDIPIGYRISTASVANRTATNGYADSDPINFIGVTVVSPVGYLVLYQDTGDSSTSRLVAYLDDACGLPLTQSTDWSYFPSPAFGGIFKL